MILKESIDFNNPRGFIPKHCMQKECIIYAKDTINDPVIFEIYKKNPNHNDYSFKVRYFENNIENIEWDYSLKLKEYYKKCGGTTKFKEQHFTKELLLNYPGWKFNKRYNTEFNTIAYLIPHCNLDTKHKFYKLKSRKTFAVYWKDFINNYESEYKQFLKDNLWARQCLLTFVTAFRKFNLLYKSKEYSWIVDETPEFYMRSFVIKYYNNRIHCDPTKWYREFRNNAERKYNEIDTYCSTDFNEESCKLCICYKTKTLAKDVKTKFHIKVNTNQIIKLFNNEIVELPIPEPKVYKNNSKWFNEHFPNLIPKNKYIFSIIGSSKHLKKNIREVIKYNRSKFIGHVLNYDKLAPYKKQFDDIVFKNAFNNLDLFKDHRYYKRFEIELQKLMIANL